MARTPGSGGRSSSSAASWLRSYAAGGGRLIVTHQTAILDENLHVRLGGYLGPLQETLGLWIEEFAPTAGATGMYQGVTVPPEASAVPNVELEGDIVGGRAEGRHWAEVVRTRAAEALATFTRPGLEGSPAVTRNTAGDGTAWYVATLPAPPARAALLRAVLGEAAVEVEELPAGVERIKRGNLTFVIDHRDQSVTIDRD